MTTPIETQCPQCQSIFDVPRTQLDQKDAKGRCSHCQHIFRINDHLVSAPQAATAPLTKDHHVSQDTTSTTKETKPSITKEDDIDDDALIYDDMEIEDTAESELDYGSLDDMDTWLTQLDTDTLPEIESTDNNTFDALPESAMSSADANSIYADAPMSNSSIKENAWLEDLLKEQNEHTEEPTPQPPETDLSQLLNDMGMSTDTPQDSQPSPAVQAPSQSRTQTSVATILWAMGCIVLALLLFAQYLIFNLDNIIKNPDHADTLQSVCAVAACSLPHADIEAFTLTNIAHQASRVQTTSGFSDISASVVNQSEYLQLLPSLKVSIYGANGLIGEFIAQPHDYLLSTQSQMAANNSKAVMFTIPVANNQIKDVTIVPIY